MSYEFLYNENLNKNTIGVRKNICIIIEGEKVRVVINLGERENIINIS